MTFFSTAPAHPHATRVAMYPPLFSFDEENMDFKQQHRTAEGNKAVYTATPVACGWAGAMTEKVTGAFGQEQ